MLRLTDVIVISTLSGISPNLSKCSLAQEVLLYVCNHDHICILPLTTFDNFKWVVWYWRCLFYSHI